MYRLYDSAISGNAYKVRLTLHKLGLPFERIEMNVDDGSTRQAAFLARNPVGQVPVLQLPDGTYLAQSDAILVYLAEDTDLWPADRLQRAQALQWMFFEQYSHEPYIAVARFIKSYGTPEIQERRKGEWPLLMERGYAALGVMEQHLAAHIWFAGDRYSIADIALYGYTHCADEGGFDLAGYPAVSAWLDRVAAQPGYVPLREG